jgi:tRNA A-37 threonylcarbamoyl transferase component Bud32
MPSYKLGGKTIKVDPHMSIGKGGEADIYKIGGGKALKIYKLPNHPDFDGELNEQKAAEHRIGERQHKLPAFPKNLPSQVIIPQELAINPQTKLISGFSMRYLDGADVIAKLRQHGYRSQVPSNDIVQIFRDLHETVLGIHSAGVIIGDFNDLNVMMLDKEVYLIDADSFQFNKFLCVTFTQRFADPLLCDPKASQLLLVKPHTRESDWYAFTALLMQSLVQVDPYGGTYQPKGKTAVPRNARPLHRITVFNPNVGYPMNAIQLDALPDDLLHEFHQIFEKDKRGEFPDGMLQSLRWTTCSSCGREHARHVCPHCAVPVVAVSQRIRGTVTSRRIFRTAGVIVCADYHNGQIMYLYHHDGKFMRETGEAVVQADLKPNMRFRVQGAKTYIGAGNMLNVFDSTMAHVTRYVVDTYGTLPMFDTNKTGVFWMNTGRLVREDRTTHRLGEDATEVFIGNSLQNQTLFWVGDKLGFGFYRAGQLSRAFVFDPARRGINDSVKIPLIRGQLVDATAYLSDSLCWFLTTTKEGQRVINRCAVISRTGSVLATSEADEGDNSWLGSLRGKTAVGPMLLSATDNGIVRVEVDGGGAGSSSVGSGTLSVTKEFPDTKGFAHSGNKLIPGDGGLYVVGGNEIVHMSM